MENLRATHPRTSHEAPGRRDVSPWSAASQPSGHATADGPPAPLDAQADPADAAPFKVLLLASLPSLRQQALALTRHRADADDLVQATVSSALGAWASFEMGTNFRAWMGRIMQNRFISDRRRRRETVDVDDAPANLLARSGGQEESLALRELRRNLARLPADHRLALMMIAVQGASYDELSERLGVAVGTLKCRVFRARRQLQIWMMGETPGRAEVKAGVKAGGKHGGGTCRGTRKGATQAAGVPPGRLHPEPSRISSDRID
jgi:RNA polymerase sigma-70 factor (ECF subfamily)